MNTLPRSLLVSVIALTAALPSRSNPILINGGFESPGITGPNWTLFLADGSTAATGWVSVDNVASAVAAADNVYYRGPYYGSPASEGDYFLYIDNNNYSSPTLNGIYQDFSTVAGQAYQVTFDASTELGGLAGKLGASAGGTSAHFTLPNSGLPPARQAPFTPFPGWFTYSFTFSAISDTTRLQFFDEGFQIGGDPLNGNASPLLDNVIVTATAPNSVADVGSTAALLAVSAMCMCAVYRRRIHR